MFQTYEYASVHRQMGLIAHELFALEIRSYVDGFAPLSRARPVVLARVIRVRLAINVMGESPWPYRRLATHHHRRQSPYYRQNHYLLLHGLIIRVLPQSAFTHPASHPRTARVPGLLRCRRWRTRLWAWRARCPQWLSETLLAPPQRTSRAVETDLTWLVSSFLTFFFFSFFLSCPAKQHRSPHHRYHYH